MKNYGIGSYSGVSSDDPRAFKSLVLEIPSVLEDDLLVEIEAISVNPIDNKLRLAGAENHTQILGFDACGKVVATGEKVVGFEPGDRVFYAGTTKRSGSNQKFQAVSAKIAAKVPDKFASGQLAALPLTSLTAWELLFEKFGLVPEKNGNLNKNILLINASGGVGSIASQLAAWAGLTVYGTSSRKNIEWLHRNGVSQAIDHRQSLVEQVTVKFDYIAVFYDSIYYIEQMADLIKPFGKIGTIVNTKEPLNLNALKNLSVSFFWEYMFTKTDVQQNVESQGQILQTISKLLQEGSIHSTLTHEFSDGITIDNLRSAIQLVERGTAGKIVVSGGFHNV